MTFSLPAKFSTWHEYAPESLWKSVVPIPMEEVPLLKATVWRSESARQFTAPHLRLHSPSTRPSLCQVILGCGDPPALHHNSAECDSLTAWDPECCKTCPLARAVKDDVFIDVFNDVCLLLFTL